MVVRLASHGGDVLLVLPLVKGKRRRRKENEKGGERN